MSEIFKSARVLLAPLVGGSDVAFRRLSRRYGARMTFTEMCIVSTWLNPKKRRDLFEFHESDRPLFLQLTDTTPEPVIEMANMDMFKGHIDGVDLNFGCPQTLIMQRGYGAGFVSLQTV
jgi:tRNA-dihydrouridine synthase 1